MHNLGNEMNFRIWSVRITSFWATMKALNIERMLSKKMVCLWVFYIHMYLATTVMSFSHVFSHTLCVFLGWEIPILQWNILSRRFQSNLFTGEARPLYLTSLLTTLFLHWQGNLVLQTLFEEASNCVLSKQ